MSLWKSNQRSARSKKSGAEGRTRKLHMEFLEQRQLLSVTTAMLDATEEVFSLHSKADASHTIYLDFDGHTTTGTYWNDGNTPIETPAFNISGYDGGDPTSFDAEEIQAMREIWAYVSEFYVGFDVDVTTEEPNVQDLIYDWSGSDESYGIRVCIGGSYEDWLGESCGGIAYVGSFSWDTDTPTFIFGESGFRWGDAYNCAEAVAHEVGHSLGLSHSSQSLNGNHTEYYAGSNGWTPIMGSGNGMVQQWSKGEYSGATSSGETHEDQLQIITNNNGFDYRTDDIGSTLSTATALTVSGSNEFSAMGIIERNTDFDVFSFTTQGGALSVNVTPDDYNRSLDVKAELLDSGGNVLVTSNSTTTLSAAIETSVEAGTYYIRVSGDGRSGAYSNYGSLGSYDVTGYAGINLNTLVTTTQDVVNANDGVVSLREAIANAKYGEKITFSKDVFHGGETITLSSTLGALVVDEYMIIDAGEFYNETTDTPGITINANRTTAAVDGRVFDVQDRAEFIGLIITGGNVANEGSLGGGIRTVNDVTMSRCWVVNNSTEGNGGGVGASNSGAIVSVTDCRFEGNTAYGSGGAITVRQSVSQINAKNSLFAGNQADWGSALQAQYSCAVFTIVNCLITGNLAGYNGAVSNYGQIIIDSSTIAGNLGNGGGVAFGSGRDTHIVRNSIIAGNYAGYGTIFDTDIQAGATVTFKNSLVGIIDNDEQGFIVDGGGNFLGSEATMQSAGFVNSGKYSMSSWTSTKWKNYDYSITSTSKAVGAGNNALARTAFGVSTDAELAALEDIAENSRLNGGTIDMGAYEFPAEGLVSATIDDTTPTVGDTLTVVVSPSGATVTYQWQADGEAISGATGKTFVVTAAQTGKVLTCVVVGSGFFSGSLTTGPTAAVTRALTGVTLSDTTPEVGDTLSATLLPSGATATYQWYAGTSAIAGATAATFTVTTAQLGAKISCVATGAGAYTGTVTSAKTAAVTQALTGLTLSDSTPDIGDTLSVTLAPAGATATYQWYRGSNEIQGANATSYTVTNADLGAILTCKATGTGNYTGQVSASISGKITAALESLTLNTSTPGIGTTLTATLGPAGATASFQWFRGSNEIQGANTSSYTVTNADLSTILTCKATGTGNYTGIVQVSISEAITTALQGLTLSTVTPHIGDVVTASLAPDGATATFQWYRGDSAIQGANASSYTVQATDLGYVLKCVATGSGTYTGTLTAMTGQKVMLGLESLTLSDSTPEVGNTLSGTLAPAGATATYQWYRGDSAIQGANASSYTVTTNDLGAILKCTATGTGNYSGSVEVSATQIVTAPLTSITLSTRTPAVGDTISTTLGPAGATASFQWYRGSTAIQGATASSYTVTIADLGTILKCTATGNGSYTGTATQSATRVVTATLTNLTLSTNAPRVGTTLTASVTPAGTNVATFEWYRDETKIENATKSSYTTTMADLGAKIKCVATGAGFYIGSVEATTSDKVVIDLVSAELNTLQPAIGDALSVTVAPTGATTSFQWYRGDTAIQNAKSSSYTVQNADLGYELSCSVVGTGNYVGTLRTVSTAKITAPLTGASLNELEPAIGDTLTLSLTPSSGTASYQWYRGDTAIQGATHAAYTVQFADLGAILTCKATGSGNYTGQVSASTTRKITITVTGLTFTQGTPQVGTTLTTNIAPSGATATYQWYRGENAIEGATDSSYTVTANDSGAFLKCVATGSGNYVGSAEVQTSQTAFVALTNVTLNNVEPKAGDTISASVAPTGATVTYQWYRGTEIISGATDSTYTVQSVDAGNFLTCTVTGTGNYRGSESATTTRAATIAISGLTLNTYTPGTGETLTATLAPSAATASFQWYRSADNATWSAISGASTKSYTLVKNDAGYHLRCVATGTGKYSGTVSATITEPMTIHLKAPSLTVTQTSETSIRVMVGESPYASEYRVEYSTYEDFSDSTNSITYSTYGSCTLENLQPGRTYYIRAYGVGTLGVENSPYSATCMAVTSSSAWKEPASTKVTMLGDYVNEQDGRISLREALSYAKQGGTITFDSSLENQTIHLFEALTISQGVTIDAKGLNITLDAEAQSNLFVVDSARGSVVLAGLNLTGGQAENGGAILHERGTLRLENCVLSENTADEGGAIYSEAALTVVNCTIVANSSGIYTTSSLSVQNSIITSNTGADLNAAGRGTPTVNESLVGTLEGKTPRLKKSLVNIAAKFVDFESGDFRLSADSPAVNAGSNTSLSKLAETDILGQRRVSGKIVDMGAYEYLYPSVEIPELSLTTEGTTILATWPPVEHTSGYKVQYRVAGASTWTTRVVKNDTSLSIRGSAGKTYEVRVSALSGVFTLDDSDAANATIRVYAPLATPRLKKGPTFDDTLTATVTNYASNLQTSTQTVVLRMTGLGSAKISEETPVLDLTSFAGGAVYEWQVAGQKVGVAFDESTGSFTFNGLQSSTSYAFQVKFANDNTSSVWSSVMRISTTKTCYNVPQNVNATVLSDSSIRVTWDGVTGKNSSQQAGTYTVQYQKNGRWTTATTRATQEGYTLTRLTAGTNYEIRVFATADRTFVASGVSESTFARTWSKLPTPRLTTTVVGKNVEIDLGPTDIAWMDDLQISYRISGTVDGFRIAAQEVVWDDTNSTSDFDFGTLSLNWDGTLQLSLNPAHSRASLQFTLLSISGVNAGQESIWSGKAATRTLNLK